MRLRFPGYRCPFSPGSPTYVSSPCFDPLRHSIRAFTPALCDVLERHLLDLAGRVPKDSPDLLERVRRALAAELQRGDPSLDAIAARLRTSPRSLQRQLQQAGTTLAALHNELRADLAARYLAERSESISEVAFLLGFSEVSTFHRAFKRWTGQTPAAYRRGRRIA